MSTVAIPAQTTIWVRRLLPWAGWMLSPGRRVDPADERAMEADLRPVVRQGVGQNRLGSECAATDCDYPADVCRAVPYATHSGAGCRAPHRLSWRCDISVHPHRRTVPGPGSTDDGPVRVGRTLFTGGALVGAAPVSKKEESLSQLPTSNSQGLPEGWELEVGSLPWALG